MAQERGIDMMTEGGQVFREIPDQSITVCSLMPEPFHDPNCTGQGPIAPDRGETKILFTGELNGN